MLTRWRLPLLRDIHCCRISIGPIFLITRKNLARTGYPGSTLATEQKWQNANTQARLFAPKLYESDPSYADLQKIMAEAHLRGSSLPEASLTALLLQILRTILLQQFNALLHSFVTMFLSLPSDLPGSSMRFNKVLHAIAKRDPQINATHDSLLRLLTAQSLRSLKVDPFTYEALFSKSFATPKFATVLKERMLIDGYPPSDKGLLYLMKAAASEGKGKIAARYAKTVRSIMRQRMLANSKACAASPKIPIAPTARLRHTIPSDSIVPLPNVHNLLTLASLRNHAVIKRHFLYLRNARQFRRFGGESVRKLPIQFWGQLLCSLARDRSVTAGQIFRIFRMLEKQPELSSNMSARFYHVVLSCLLAKDSESYHLALNVWRSLKNKYREEEARRAREGVQERNPWKLDRYSLSLGIRMFCKMGRYMDAFIMVDNLARRKRQVQAATRDHLKSPDDHHHIPHSIQVDAIVFQTLFSEFNRAGRADVLWFLWAEMGNRYTFPRDDELLSLLINAATFNSAGGEHFIKDRPYFGLDAVAFSLAEKFTKTITSRKYARLQSSLEGLSFQDKIVEILRHPRSLPQDVLWDGLPAWQRARLLFLEVMLGNHPGLANVENPVPLTGPTGNTQIGSQIQTSPLEISLTPSSSPYGQHIEFQHLPTIHDIPKPPHSPLYPEISLSDRLFRSYIVLLGEHLLEDQIPLTLAWMRALGIKPNKWTVATALVYFKRATHDQVAPLDDRVRGDRITGEYRTLLDWVIVWLGKENMPSVQEIGKVEQRVSIKRG
ncbi:hypothetical protein FRC03_002886 [Tulasnella sp. 419]|nr:hypothetical protein FRC03_002886 [Tulasnella sp. 419]